VYVGIAATRWLTIAIEVEELYALTADVSSPSCPAPCDEYRSVLVLEPSVRLHLPRLSPALSILVPLATPLRAEVESYVAGRLQLEVPLDWRPARR